MRNKSLGLLKTKKGVLHYKEFELDLEAEASIDSTGLSAKAILERGKVRCSNKLQVFFQNPWNICDLT